jgi:DNA repair protein RadC
MTSLKHWSKESLPSERIRSQRPGTLSIPELISILLRTGNGQHNAVELAMRLLDHFDHQLIKLANASALELMKVKGIGKAKATTIAAALELGRRVKKEPLPERYFIRHSSDSAYFVRHLLGNFDHAKFGALYLVQAGWVADAGVFTVKNPASGIQELKLLLKKALEVGAVSIITYEIIPSATLRPDCELKNRVGLIRSAAKMVDIKLLDHLLINKDHHFSFGDRGLL